jgi:hypothetical protein
MIILIDGEPDPEYADALAEIIGYAHLMAEDEVTVARVRLAAAQEALELAQARCMRILERVRQANQNCVETRAAANVVLTSNGYVPA